MNKLYGTVFKIHRKKAHLSCEAISQKTGISYPNISRFENGSKLFSDDQLKLVYNALGMSYQSLDNSEKIVEELVLNIYLNIASSSSKEEDYQKLLDIKEQVQCTPAYLIWLLGDFVQAVFNNNSLYDYPACIPLLKKTSFCFSEALKQVFYDTLGTYYYFDLGLQNEALEYFNKGLNYHASSIISAMLLYHKSIILYLRGDLFKARSCVESSKKRFDKNLFFERSLMCSSVLGIVYSRNGNHQKAEQIFLQCILASKKINFPVYQIQRLYNNLLWDYLISENYESIIKYRKEALALNKEDADILFYIAYAYWKLGNIKKAKEYLKYTKDHFEKATKQNQFLIEAFTSILLEKSYDLIESKLLKLVAYNEKNTDYQMKEIAFKLLAEQSEIHGKTKKTVKYQKKVIKILEKRV